MSQRMLHLSVDGAPLCRRDLPFPLVSENATASGKICRVCQRALERLVRNCCKMGEHCIAHANVVHGQEAEELRSGIEALITTHSVSSGKLQAYARDSLAFIEARIGKKHDKNKIRLRPGKMYVAKDGSIWCCFRVQLEVEEHRQADCVRVDTGRVECFYLDGRYDYKGEREVTLVKEL